MRTSKDSKSMSDKKNILLTDNDGSEIVAFNESLSAVTGKQFEICAYVSNWGRNSKSANLKRYFRYFSVPFKIFRKRKRYDTIVGWQQFYTLLYCYYCRLFHVKKRSTVVALNFTYKAKSGIKGKIYKHIMKKIVQSKYLDCIHIPSYSAKSYILSELNIDESKIIVSTFGVEDIYSEYKSSANPVNDKYILALGRSNRDYGWLVDSWTQGGIVKKLVIICDMLDAVTAKKAAENPNIIVLDNISGENQYPYIINCECMILPISDGNICSGDTVLLTAMSFEKTAIITKPSTLSEMYIEDGVTGICINKEIGELKSAIMREDEFGKIGKQARDSYLENFSRRAMGENIGKALLNIN